MGFELFIRPEGSACEDHASKYQLSVSSKMAKARTNSRSTPLGLPSGRLAPRAVTMMGPRSPVFMSFDSTKCEWYIHNTELPSIGPGPARSGAYQRYV